MEKTKENNRIRDINSKGVFGNATLCAQFLRDNVDIPLLKDVKPEDIEDVTERYQPFIGVEFESDTVNKIRIPSWSQEGENLPLYLISIVEHKSQVDYNVAMQILRYMVCIWYEYRKEMEKKYPGCSQRKAFRYPPILPVVYYEGKGNWTADMHLKDRIINSELFEEYIPDFKYKLIRLHDYSNEELLDRGDEMSLIMMINKIQSAEEFHDFFTLSPEKLGDMVGHTPEHVKEVIQNLLYGLLTKMNVPEQEKSEYVKRIGDKGMGNFFENMEPMDIQAERRNTAEARRQAEEALARLEEAQSQLRNSEDRIKELEKRIKEAGI